MQKLKQQIISPGYFTIIKIWNIVFWVNEILAMISPKCFALMIPVHVYVYSLSLRAIDGSTLFLLISIHPLYFGRKSAQTLSSLTSLRSGNLSLPLPTLP